MDPRKAGLALQLDDGTRKSHSVAENSAFVTGFFRGIAEKQTFAQLVADLYFVYEAMEDSFEKSEDANVRTLDYPELRRVASLEAWRRRRVLLTHRCIDPIVPFNCAFASYF